jgi:ABC-type multidrug transport system ATPase subunit
VDTNEHLSNAADHLSYGERNAFSIVLFMYDCLANNPDLIILDDPISSFDKTKKYAIMQRLFTGTNTLKGKTVLMMTHDVEPIIDIAKVRELNSQVKPYNSFLSLENGKITEIEIESNDLQSFAQICKENIASEDVPDIIKAIYLRRHYEILDNKGIEYQMLASLFHLRPTPTNETGIKREFTAEEKKQAQKNIKASLTNFDYGTLLKELRNKDSMRKKYEQTSNRYEKLQLFRLIQELNKNSQTVELHKSSVIRKHINEAFHIENELITQLNPKKYDFVPEYVITECNLTLGVTN